MLTVAQSVNVAKGAVTNSIKDAAKITAGNVIIGRVANMVAGTLPVYARGYAQTEAGKAAIGAMAATALIHFLPNNAQARLAADAMFKASGLTFVQSFNIESKLEELLAGIDLGSLAADTQAANA